MCCQAVQKLFRSDVVGEVSLEVCARVADALEYQCGCTYTHYAA